MAGSPALMARCSCNDCRIGPLPLWTNSGPAATLSTPASGFPTPTPTPAQAPVPVAGGARLSPMIQVKLGVVAPPSFDANVSEALRRLLLAHSRAGQPMTTITDWYRDATTNLRTPGASPSSQHTFGTAFDLRADAAGAAVARQWALGGDEVIDETGRVDRPHWHLERASAFV